MPKPTLSQSRWASVTAANRIEPTAGLKDDGWAVGDQPASQHLNFLLYTVYLWLVWLDGQISTDIAAQAWAWTGLQTWSSLATFNSGIQVVGASGFDGAVGIVGGLQVDNLFIDGGAVDIDATGEITVDEYHFNTVRSRMFTAGSGYDTGADWTKVDDTEVSATVADPSAYIIPIMVESGETITVKLKCAHSVATAGSIRAVLYRIAGNIATVVDTEDSAASTAEQDLTVASAHAAVTRNAYQLYISANGGTGGAQTRALYDVTVEYVR